VSKYDLSYLTTDSIEEGVGSSQIVPLLLKLSESGLKISLISYEKGLPSNTLKNLLTGSHIDWTPLHFDRTSMLGPMKRLRELAKSISPSHVIHARSDIPAMSAVMSEAGPVLWDIRSLWSDQRRFIETNKIIKFGILGARLIESFDANHVSGISTLTKAVVPELESRYKALPKIRAVVPTAVDLEHYQLSEVMPKKLRALFSGTYNSYYDLELSSRFCEALGMKKPLEIHWARPRESTSTTLGFEVDQVFRLTRSEMCKVITESTFGVSICRNDAGVSLKAAVPTKIAEFLAVGRPVVVNKGLGDFDEMFHEFDAGVILDGSIENLKQGVEKMLSLVNDPETPFRCRALAEKYFSLDVGVDNYLNTYRQIG
jgi:glycosyltransferase involved in cell wall biosynthesis